MHWRCTCLYMRCPSMQSYIMAGWRPIRRQTANSFRTSRVKSVIPANEIGNENRWRLVDENWKKRLKRARIKQCGRNSIQLFFFSVRVFMFMLPFIWLWQFKCFISQCITSCFYFLTFAVLVRVHNDVHTSSQVFLHLLTISPTRNCLLFYENTTFIVNIPYFTFLITSITIKL